MRQTSYVSSRTIRRVSWLLGLIGLVAAIAGPAYAINGATQSPAPFRVPVELQAGPGAEAKPGRIRVQLPEPNQSLHVTSPNQGASVELTASDSTVSEQLLARGDTAVLGLAIGIGALLLRPVLNSLASGRPFVGGNARRIAGLAVLVAVTAQLSPLLPQVASLLVLDRLNLTGPSGPFVLGLHLSFGPALLVALVLLILAEAFRQGERIHRDVEGLV